MRMFLLLLYCSFCLRHSWSIKTSSHSDDEKAKIIVDFVKLHGRPVAVYAMVCWKKSKKVNLMMRLGALPQPSTAKFLHSDKFKLSSSGDVVFVVDLSCSYTNRFLKQAEEKEVFRNPNRWLIITTLDSDIIPQQLQKINVLPNSEVFIARENKFDYFAMYSIYKVHPEGVWHTENYGTWTSALGMQKTKSMSTSPAVRRKNMARYNIATAFNVNDEDVGYDLKQCDERIRRSKHRVTRWGFEQMLVLYDYLNATRVNVFTQNWGYFVNGSWNGIIGNMARGEVELAGTAIFISRSRMEFAEYLTDPVLTGVKFVFREPPLSYQNNLFLLPFNKTVWSALGVFILLLVVVIYINARWESKKMQILKDEFGNVSAVNKMNISDVAMMILGAISQQGNSVQLKGSIGRLVMFNLFLACLFLFTAYSANIVALLQSSSKQIRTLTDLLNSRLELGAEDTAYNIHYFTTATEPVRKAIYETKIAPRGSKPNFMSVEEGVKKLQKHPFAFNMDIGHGYRLIEEFFYEHEKCGLREIAYVPPYKPWLTCRRGSPYAEIFKIGLYRMREHGMGARANGLVYSKKPVCSISGGSFDSVSIMDAYPPLLLLLYGMLSAFTLLLLEILVHRYRKREFSVVY